MTHPRTIMDVAVLGVVVAAIMMLVRPGSRGPSLVSAFASALTYSAAVTEGATTGHDPAQAAGTAAAPDPSHAVASPALAPSGRPADPSHAVASPAPLPFSSLFG